MELKQLRFFVTSADIGSFKGAAQALYTTQSHVSKIIKALEREMQVDLFDRTPEGVELTAAGKEIYAQAGGILQRTELLQRSGEERPGQKLYISSVPDGRLSEIFARFCQREKNSDIRYQFLEAAVEDIMRHMHRHVSEIGFVYIPKSRMAGFTRQLEDNRLEFVRIKKTGICLLVGKNSPFYGLNSMEPSALREMRLVQPDEDLYFVCTRPSHKYINFFFGHDGQTIVRTNSDSVVEGILGNTDMGTVSCGRPPGRSGQGRLWAVPLNGMKDSVYFGYIKRKKDALSPTAKRFIAYLVKMMK